MSLRFTSLSGTALDAALDDLAALRITVFREWPYLYDGDMAYERRYMASYQGNARAILVGAFDGPRLVGAATGTPLADHADDFAAAFADQPMALEDVFYCAESVLLPAYRGRGAGHTFFDSREDHARRLGFRFAAFCAVVRPDDHPARPLDYRPLDAFWRKRSYAPLHGAVTRFPWRDVGEATETAKPMQFWSRTL